VTTAAGTTGERGRRSLLVDIALLCAGAALTIVFAHQLVHRPVPAAAGLALFAVVAGVVLLRGRIAALSLRRVLIVLVTLIPLAALLGPAAGLPAFPQLFAFRLLLVAVAAVAVPVLLLSAPRTLETARWRPALPLVLWVGWLCLALLWAPDKAAGLTYLLLLATMLAVTAAAASAGLSRRRLIAFGLTMIVAYVAIIGVTVLEYTVGFRLPTSRLVAGAGSQFYAVTSVFHNQNDLATYLALCWPFLFTVAFFTRRVRWLALALVLTVPGALAFVRTGSRSSLLAVGISTIVVLVVLARPTGWLRTRQASLFGAALAVALFAVAGYLLFNESENPMLRQFRLSALLQDVSSGRGSGSIRTDLYERGVGIAGDSFLLGAGPGQAPGLLTRGTGGTGLGNLHNWWLELYAEGGLPGLLLHLTFFAGLVAGLVRKARASGDPFVRYLAVCAFAALAGFVIGALGPSRSLSFAPMWVLYGLALAVLAVPVADDGDPLPVAGDADR
jgi:O-antigen ligase